MAYDMFFKIGAIKGESQDSVNKGDDGWIDILAWSWGVSNSGTTHMGSGSGSGVANFQDISITKYVDTATADLLKAAATGVHHPEAQLIVRKAGGTQMNYLEYKLTDVIITSISTGGSGGEERLTENVAVNFGAFEMKYTAQEVAGTPGTAPEFKYDIAAKVEL